MRRVLVLLGLVGCATLRGTDGRIDSIFSYYDKDGPGCAVAAVRDGQVLYAHAYGRADLDHATALDADSVFHVASVSKQFTAFAILLLEHRGRLSLDDDVRKYVPEVPDFGGRRITLRHLATHTSGLRDQWDLLDMAGWRVEEDIITTADILDLVSHQHDLNFDPGAEHYYCNTGFTLLAVVVERVSGKSLRKFAQEEIFRPLGMTRTHFHDDHSEVVAGRAEAYERRPDGAWHRFIPGFDTVGATSLFTTVLDLAKWAGNFDRPAVGDAAVLAELVEPGRLNDGTVLDYAKGIAVGKYRGLRVVEHGGRDAAYRSFFVHFPEQHFSVACLCGMAESQPTDLAYRVADVYLRDVLQSPPPAPPAGADAAPGVYYHARRDEVIRVDDKKPRPVPPGFQRVEPTTSTPLSSYTGTYWSDELAVEYRVVLRDGTLYLRRRKHRDEPLRAFMDAGFTSEAYTVHFLPDGGMTLTTGRVRRLRFSRTGR